ncbi:MAG: hypothetical protein V4543_12115 [Bacteroidota bacterium]
MKWYTYIAAFFAGAFLANSIPHFVQGVSGNAFPSPFSTPPGIGLSSAPVNVTWGLFNMFVGVWLFRAGKVKEGNLIITALFIVGFSAMSLNLGSHFTKKQKEAMLYVNPGARLKMRA